jgi:phosphoribosylformimino-5-aminoimidazole carboxamide ribotide isomerase
MELVLAMDLRRNMVVHGKSGLRTTYKPLDWGCSPTAEPLGYVQALAPKYLYIADLDRIEGTGSHDAIIEKCADEVDCCYVDRGCTSPGDMLEGRTVVNIVGTETGGSDLSQYPCGFLSLDVKEGKVIPSGADPVQLLGAAQHWKFSGIIILNIGAVGTERGIDPYPLERWRAAYDGRLFYGGGVATIRDLETISRAGFDGTIISTALHRGAVPLEWIRRGCCC